MPARRDRGGAPLVTSWRCRHSARGDSEPVRDDTYVGPARVWLQDLAPLHAAKHLNVGPSDEQSGSVVHAFEQLLPNVVQPPSLEKAPRSRQASPVAHSVSARQPAPAGREEGPQLIRAAKTRATAIIGIGLRGRLGKQGFGAERSVLIISSPVGEMAIKASDGCNADTDRATMVSNALPKAFAGVAGMAPWKIGRESRAGVRFPPPAPAFRGNFSSADEMGSERRLISSQREEEASLGSVGSAMKVRACTLTVTLTLLLAAAPAHSDASLPTAVSGLPWGRGKTVIARTASAFFIASSSSYLKGDAESESGIYRLPRAGGTPARIAVVPGEIWALVVDGDDLFFRTFDGGIYRLSVRGGAATRLDTDRLEKEDRSLKNGRHELAVDAGFVYYNNSVWMPRREGFQWSEDNLMRVPRRGGRPERLLGDFRGKSIAVDAGYVYVTHWVNSKIVRVPTQGGAPELVTDDVGLIVPDNLRVGADEVYFIDDRPGRIGAAPKRGGPVRWLRKDLLAGLSELDLDGDTLFVLEGVLYDDQHPQRVFRLKTNGRERKQLGPVVADDCTMAFDRRGGLLLCSSGLLRRWDPNEP